MAARALAATLLRLWGLKWVVTTCTQVVSFLSVLPGRGHGIFLPVATYAIGILFSGLIAWFLLRHADTIAAKLIRDDVHVLSIGRDELQQIGFALVGAYFLVAGLKSLAIVIYVFAARPE